MGAGSGEIYRQFSSVLGAEGKGAGDAKNKESKDNKESKSVVVEKQAEDQNDIEGDG